MIFQEKIFTENECKLIIGLAKPIHNFTHHTEYNPITGKVHYFDKSFKKSYNVSIIHYDEKSKWIFKKLLKWFSEKTNIQIKDGVTLGSGLLHTYYTGDCFEKHIDVNDEFNDRCYNIGIQLNNDYSGGDYNYWINDNMYSFSKDIGNAILYPVNLLHEISEITNGIRISFVTHINKNLLKTKSII